MRLIDADNLKRTLSASDKVIDDMFGNPELLEESND